MLIFFPFPDKSNFCFVRGCTFFGSHGGTRREKFTIKTKVDDNKHETTTIEHKASVVYECWWPVRPPQICITN